ncbi:hypothetical protein K1T71_006836 [Dendrolimus kikuchii]|uniref:Uncharacterized protein n=1 Tax=Dendrolimus kikuchii TaxID=765133 RepID=A0ACC1D251_9NEOP|nr:hypothetical protein K1T71_006836 [Dendrolimus kikuchii]
MLLKVRNFMLPVFRLRINKNLCTVFLSTSTPKEEIIEVGNYKINYVKVGTGSTKLLCMPGGLGTIWTDFKPQVEGIDKEKFTLVAWDPPGYGKSRPPQKKFTTDFYERDADTAYTFMQALNIPKYSILGWSDGGICGMIHAAKYPNATNKLVIWGANSFILPQELEIYKKIRDIKSWSERMRQPMIEVYGEELFAKYWSDWVDAMELIYRENKGNICSQFLKDIKCPTFILYGEKDPLVDKVHVSHLHTNIDGSKIHLYPKGKHNVHINMAEDFNKRVQDFLLAP